MSVSAQYANRCWCGIGRVLIAALICTFLAPARAQADELWGSIRIPGGVTGFRLIAGVAGGPRLPSTVLLDLVRSQYRISTEGSGPFRETLEKYISLMRALEESLAAWPDGLSVATITADRRRRDAFRDTVELLGLKMRTSGDRISVEVDRDGESVLRQRWLAYVGIISTAIADDLNAGKTVRVKVPVDEVPLPLPELWSRIVFRQGTDPLIQFVREPKSQLLYLGISGLDRPTLAWLSSNPEVFHKLHDDRYAMFAAFGHGFRVDKGVVITPGGPSAVPIWERLVDAHVKDPARFLSNLFEKNDGRLAYFYATVFALDAARQDFVLGAHVLDRRQGKDRWGYVENIKDWFVFANPMWSIQRQALFRPKIDPAIVLSLIDVDKSGSAGPDWWPSLLQRVAESDDWPVRPKDTLSRLRPTTANANWVLGFVFDKPAESEHRWLWLRFAQRRMAAVPQTSAQQFEITLHALKEMPALVLALERLGVSDPAVYADVAWAAKRLSSAGGPSDVVNAQRVWQGGLAILEQVGRHRPLAPDVLRTTLGGLARAVGDKPLEPSGEVASWLLHVALPALGATVEPDEDMEAAVFRAALAPQLQSTATFDWDGVKYRVDTKGPVITSALALRAVMTGPRLQHLAILDGAATRLTKPFKSLEEVTAVAADLQRVVPSWKTDDLNEAIRNLSRIRAVKDLSRAVRERERLLRTIDEMAADLLPSLAYALAVSSTGQPARVYADAPRVHELASKASGRWVSMAWSPGETAQLAAGGTAVHGSLLGLDLAFGVDFLSRPPGPLQQATAAGDPIHALTEGILVDRIVIHGRDGWADKAGDVVKAIARGRERINTWMASPVDSLDSLNDDALVREWSSAGLSAARQNQLRWLLQRHDTSGIASALGPTDLYRLGSPDELPAGWGQSARQLEGCWCLRGVDRGPIDRFFGYSVGYVTAAQSELTLRLAEILATMGIPATVIEPMMPFALQDMLDHLVQFAPDDWEALTWAGRLTPERVDDYLQALVSRQILAPPAEPGR